MAPLDSVLVALAVGRITLSRESKQAYPDEDATTERID